MGKEVSIDYKPVNELGPGMRFEQLYKLTHDLTVGVLAHSNPNRICPESFLP